MKTLKVKRYAGWASLILLVILMGCNNPTLSPTATSVSATATPHPTMTASPTPSPELPTITPTPSPIPPTRTPVLTHTSSPTPAPTLTADEEQALVFGMLKDNGGCPLPCWWGFTPGETSWETTKTFFASLGKRAETWRVQGTQHYTVYFDIPDYDHYHYQGYHERDGRVERIGIHSPLVVEEDGNPVSGDPQFAKEWEAYLLPQMLTTYGQPTQIFLGVSRGVPWTPFDLLLFYPEQGILAQYSGPASQEGETFRVCPHQVEIALYLWPPGHYATLEAVPGIAGYMYAPDEMSGIQLLEAATELSTEQFYHIFTQPTPKVCLETPVEIW